MGVPGFGFNTKAAADWHGMWTHGEVCIDAGHIVTMCEDKGIDPYARLCVNVIANNEGNAMFVVVFNRTGELHCETEYYGPFPSWDEAYEYHCTLPGPDRGGWKFVNEVFAPKY